MITSFGVLNRRSLLAFTDEVACLIRFAVPICGATYHNSHSSLLGGEGYSCVEGQLTS